MTETLPMAGAVTSSLPIDSSRVPIAAPTHDSRETLADFMKKPWGGYLKAAHQATTLDSINKIILRSPAKEGTDRVDITYNSLVGSIKVEGDPIPSAMKFLGARGEDQVTVDKYTSTKGIQSVTVSYGNRLVSVAADGEVTLSAGFPGHSRNVRLNEKQGASNEKKMIEISDRRIHDDHPEDEHAPAVEYIVMSNGVQQTLLDGNTASADAITDPFLAKDLSLAQLFETT